MIVQCKYFELREKKIMQDGYFISPKQKLLYICTEDDLIQFETVDDTDVKKIFWAGFYEVDFLYEVQEEWSLEKIEQREKEITGKWL